jgi:hypothetical protein
MHWNDTLDQAEKAVEDALDALVEKGALHTRNRMDIESLLNPVEESQDMEETSDEEIFKAVMECRAAQDDAPGGDDVDDKSPCEPCPSRREALQALLLINRYVQTLDDPIARKVEAALSSLARQTRYEAENEKKDTKITDFFGCS